MHVLQRWFRRFSRGISAFFFLFFTRPFRPKQKRTHIGTSCPQYYYYYYFFLFRTDSCIYIFIHTKYTCQLCTVCRSHNGFCIVPSLHRTAVFPMRYEFVMFNSLLEYTLQRYLYTHSKAGDKLTIFFCFFELAKINCSVTETCIIVARNRPTVRV